MLILALFKNIDPLYSFQIYLKDSETPLLKAMGNLTRTPLAVNSEKLFLPKVNGF